MRAKPRISKADDGWQHPLGVRPAALGSPHFQNEMEHWLLGPNIDTWQPTGIRRTRDGWIDSTEEQGTTKQGETD